jgi:phosphoserine phosphatase RsbU/P
MTAVDHPPPDVEPGLLAAEASGIGLSVLVAEDDPVSRAFLVRAVRRWGYEVVECSDGDQALRVLTSAAAPPLAVLDWLMPGREGIAICRAVRDLARSPRTYLILLTARAGKQDLVAGLEAGADDYLAKPFDEAELRARLQVGARLYALQERLSAQVKELEAALADVKRLRGLLPMCAWCKKVRDDSNYWQRIETYLSQHSEASFTHCICPECYHGLVPEDQERP